MSDSELNNNNDPLKTFLEQMNLDWTKDLDYDEQLQLEEISTPETSLQVKEQARFEQMRQLCETSLNEESIVMLLGTVLEICTEPITEMNSFREFLHCYNQLMQQRRTFLSAGVIDSQPISSKELYYDVRILNDLLHRRATQLSANAGSALKKLRYEQSFALTYRLLQYRIATTTLRLIASIEKWPGTRNDVLPWIKRFLAYYERWLRCESFLANTDGRTFNRRLK